MNICSTHLKLKTSNICDFDKILKTECNLKYSPETAELRIWMTLKEMRQTVTCREQDI